MATTTICGAMLAAAVLPSTAMAQNAPSSKTEATDNQTIVVTGSILRKKNLKSIVPLTTITSADLEKRGVTTVESAVQNVAGNNGGAMNNNWSAGGNFAAGASGVSLRGLTTNSTLVLVDGMRMAYYPLADDATRNFVDLNTIPNAIIDRVEVLQDGASSTYGSDAIAGVINVITKKNFQGFSGKASVGAPAEHSGAGVVSLSGTWGKGDLGSDGYNFYVSGEYQKNESLQAKDAGFPYNTANQSSYCGASTVSSSVWFPDSGVVTPSQNIGVNAAGKTCRTNSIVNGIQFNDVFTGVGSTTVATVRPYDATNTTAMGNWQLLNPTAGCGSLTPVTITANQVRRAVAGVPAGTVLCQQDLVKDFLTIQPEMTRKSLSARLTKRFSDTMEGYVALNFYQNDVYYSGRGGPRNIQSTTTPGAAGTVASTAGIALPVYICPRTTVGACNSGNGTLNPNNPFAASNQAARIVYLFSDIPYNVATQSKNIRFATGLTGDADGWHYDLNLTAMKTNLTYTRNGVPNLQHIRDVVKDGSYNFMNPSQNTQAVRDYVAPRSIQKSESELFQLQANASKPLMDLAGGPLQLGVGASFRYERVANPSANPDPTGLGYTTANPNFDRYSSSINPFGATGYRHVNSVFFELDAPFTDKLTINTAGRFDSYSTGFANFSPKVSASYKAMDTLTLRGSFSKGFRAPSIAENNADPSTGFVTVTAPASFLTLHGNNGYGNPYSYGKTTVAAHDLKPETSENTTLGAIWQPVPWLGFTADYYIIHKHNIIQGGDVGPAITAYFAGTPIPAGFTVIPGVPDPLNPTALPTPGFVQYTLINLAAQDTAGLDLSVTGRFNLGPVKWTSAAEATYIQYYTQTFPSGVRQRYDGTLGNNTITSGSGTPKLRWNWQNNFDFGKLSLTATAYHISGYKAVAADNNDNVYSPDCVGQSTSAKYRDGSTIVKCNVEGFTSVDLHGSYQITKNYSIALDVLNAFSANAPYDPSGTYGITNYNPAFTASGMMGRYVKLTGKVTF